MGFLWPFVPHVNSKNPWSVRTSFRSSFTAASRSWTGFRWKSALGKSEIPNLEKNNMFRFHELNLGGGNLSKKSMCLLFCSLLVCSSTNSLETTNPGGKIRKVRWCSYFPCQQRNDFGNSNWPMTFHHCHPFDFWSSGVKALKNKSVVKPWVDQWLSTFNLQVHRLSSFPLNVSKMYIYKMYEEEFTNLHHDIWQNWAKIHVYMGKTTLTKKTWKQRTNSSMSFFSERCLLWTISLFVFFFGAFSNWRSSLSCCL